MSEKSSGTTSIAVTSAPASSARCASSGPDSSSLARRDTLVETVRTQVRTRCSVRDRSAPPVPAAAAGLLQQLDALDAHAPLEALDHVVDRERRDRRGGHGLHLDPGL